MRIHDYLDYWAMRTPDALCLDDGTRQMSWVEVQAWTRQIGQWLASRFDPRERVGVLAKNSLEILAIYMGASRTGVVPVPLNTRLAAPEWSFILGDAGVSTLIAEAEFAPQLTQVEGSFEFVAIGDPPAGWSSFADLVGAQPPVDTGRVVTEASPIYQMYTSGTTGLPKGAVLTQGAVAANIAQIGTTLGISQSRIMVIMPLFHAGATLGAFSNIACGSSSRIMRDFIPTEIIRVLREQKTQIVTFVPAMVQALLLTPGVDEAPYPDLELITYGAAPMATEVLRRAMEIFGCDFLQAYGMTELSACATFLYPEDHVRALAGEPELLLSAGRPALGTDVRIVDADDNDVAPGETGEVAVRGPQVMAGYWHRDEASSEALRNGWMHTGDAGHMDDQGYIYLSDRVKDMIVSGGENVYPREIEEVLFQLKGVVDAAVVGVPDERWGEAGLAFIVADPAVGLTGEAILEHCRSRLAKFKCPTAVEFIAELPRNATGKVLKRELRAPYWEGRERQVN